MFRQWVAKKTVNNSLVLQSWAQGKVIYETYFISTNSLSFIHVLFLKLWDSLGSGFLGSGCMLTLSNKGIWVCLSQYNLINISQANDRMACAELQMSHRVYLSV